jgi:hypothetical protein
LDETRVSYNMQQSSTVAVTSRTAEPGTATIQHCRALYTTKSAPQSAVQHQISTAEPCTALDAWQECFQTKAGPSVRVPCVNCYQQAMHAYLRCRLIKPRREHCRSGARPSANVATWSVVVPPTTSQSVKYIMQAHFCNTNSCKWITTLVIMRADGRPPPN